MNTYQERPRKGGGTESLLAGTPPFNYVWRRLLPIAFTAENAQKVHAGTKTQTRRLLNPQPEKMASHSFEHPSEGWWTVGDNTGRIWKPRYRVGDVLWVQEPWRTGDCTDKIKPTCLHESVPIHYESDKRDFTGKFRGKLRPGRFLPLRFARPHRYEVTAVRLERVNEITQDDGEAEGCAPDNYSEALERNEYISAANRFKLLWNSIHIKPGTRFEDAPWCFVYEWRKLL